MAVAREVLPKTSVVSKVTVRVSVSLIVNTDVSVICCVIDIGISVVAVTRDVLPNTSVVSKVTVRVSVSLSVNTDVSVICCVVKTVAVLPGTSIVRTVVIKTGTMDVAVVREVLPKTSVVSKVSVALEIWVSISVVRIVEMLSLISTVWKVRVRLDISVLS